MISTPDKSVNGNESNGEHTWVIGGVRVLLALVESLLFLLDLLDGIGLVPL